MHVAQREQLGYLHKALMGTTKNFEQMGIENRKVNESGFFGKIKQGQPLVYHCGWIENAE